MNSQKELLRQMLFQNMTTNSYALDRVTNENKGYKLNH